MAMFHGYFDESGKAHQHQVIVFSGFVTAWDRWERLGEEWKRLLREFDLPAVHFSEHQQQTSMLGKFIREIKRHVEFGISVSIKVDAFNGLPEELKKRLGGDAFYVAFKAVVLTMLDKVIVEPGATMSFTCDEDEETAKYCFRWYKALKRDRPDARTKLVSFCVADDSYFPQLQASDVFAGVNRAQAESCLLGTDHRCKELFAEFEKHETDSRLLFALRHLDDSDLRWAASEWSRWQASLATPNTGLES